MLRQITPLLLAVLLLAPSGTVAGAPASVPATASSEDATTRHERVVLEASGLSDIRVRTAVLSDGEAKAINDADTIVAPNIPLSLLEGFEGCEGLGSRDASDFAGSGDPLAYMQWAIKRLRAERLWADPVRRTITVAIIDTGVDYSHPDLRGVEFVHDYNALRGRSGAGSAYDDHGHGTHVAGIIAAARGNGRGVAGLAAGAVRIMPIKVLDSGGSGDLSGVLDGVTWAIEHGADLISMSLGGDAGGDDAVLAAGQAAFRAAAAAGIPLIAAAGNDGEYDSPASFPAHLEEAIAVGATDARNRLATFSTRGLYVDLAAPGEQIMSTVSAAYRAPRGDYACWSGTSMATPYVTAAAALLMAQRPALSGFGAINALIASAQDLGPAGPDGGVGYGRIRPLEASTLTATTPAWSFRPALDLADPSTARPAELWIFSNLPAGSDCRLQLRASGAASATIDLDGCNAVKSSGVASFFAALPEAPSDGGVTVSAELSATLPNGAVETQRVPLRVYTPDLTPPAWGEIAAHRWSLALEPIIHLPFAARDSRGVDHYEVAGLTATGATSVQSSGLPFVEAAARPGETLAIEVAPLDASRNRGARIRLAMTLPDANADLRWSGGHETRAHRFALGGSLAASRQWGATLRATCDGTAVAIYAPRGAGYAAFAIDLDGQRVATVDPARLPTSAVFSTPLWSAEDLADGAHEIVIAGLGSDRRPLGAVIDAIGCRSGALIDPSRMSVAAPWDPERAAAVYGNLFGATGNSRAAWVRAAQRASRLLAERAPDQLPASLRDRLQAGQGAITTSAAAVRFSDVACRTARHCLANSSQGTYVSGDGGQRWRPTAYGSADDATIDCLPAPRGLCLTSDFWGMTVGRTIDGGQTWHQTDENHIDWFWDAACATNGLCTSTGAIFAPLFVSTDSGLTWQTEQVNSSPFAVQGTGSECAELVCYSSDGDYVLRTELDGTGTPASSFYEDQLIGDDLAISCLNDRECTAVGAFTGGAFTTRDGGVTWRFREVFAGSPTGVACRAGGACVAVGRDRIYERRSWDSGWTMRYRWQPRNNKSWPGAAYVSARVVLLGYGTGIYRSLDGGASWSRIPVWR